MTARRWAAVAFACAVVSAAWCPPAGAAILWEAGMETGDRSEWTGFQAAGERRVPVVTRRFMTGGKALALEVRAGDQGPDVCDPGCERAQIAGPAIHDEGDEDWTAVGFYVPRDFPAAADDDGFQTNWQFYGPPSIGSPPLEFGVSQDARTIVVARNWWPGTDGDPSGGQTHERLADLPLRKGVWQKFVWHVRWSSDDDTGFAELFHAPYGRPLRRVVRRRRGATLLRQNTEGLAGLAANYRSRDSGLGTTRVYFDAIRTATTFGEAASTFGDLQDVSSIGALAAEVLG